MGFRERNKTLGKIARAGFQGKSKTKYSFHVYGSNTKFKDDVGIYIFTERVVNPETNKGSHKLLYIGETSSFGTRIANHENRLCNKQMFEGS